MFERYTEKARRVIFYARYEASEFGSPVIDPDHLLLGLVREEKLVGFRWVPKAKPDAIRAAVESWTQRQSKIPTSVDLPLSKTAKNILKHARDEADRLSHKHIGTEHLLLGFLEEDCRAATLLKELGADSGKLRVQFEQDRERGGMPSDITTLDQMRSAIKEKLAASAVGTIQIHGQQWNIDYIRDGVKRCRARNWHWQRASWKPRDIVVHRKTGRFSFDLDLAGDSENFEILKGGWKKDHCAVCGWELFESDDDHGGGYTNGRRWVCLECYDKFWERADFASGAFSDLT